MSVSAKKAAPAKKVESSSRKEAAASLSRKDIEDQVRAFLQSGGKIQAIPNGVSGQQQVQPTRKHIVISKKRV